VILNKESDTTFLYSLDTLFLKQDTHSPDAGKFQRTSALCMIDSCVYL